MGRVNTPVINKQERARLENGLRSGKSHAFRMRCQAILLKSEGRKSKDVASIVGMCHVSVNSWLKRYKDAFTSPEHCRNYVAAPERRLVKSRRLYR